MTEPTTDDLVTLLRETMPQDGWTPHIVQPDVRHPAIAEPAAVTPPTVESVAPSAGYAEVNAGSALLDELDQLLARYVVFPSEAARHAVALWVLHCHAIDAFESTPRLAFLSPEKGSGKTRALEVLTLVVPKPMHTVNMSASALFRVVASEQPTLLLDEADTYLGLTTAKNNEDIRGLINAGHRRGAVTYRSEISGKSVNVIPFPAFAACALAGIGDLPDTITDRAVIVTMKRRAPNEQVDAFRERIVRPQTEDLRDRLEAWADENKPRLEVAWPELPASIIDRAADVWEPLVAVADAAGGNWPDRARAAAVALNDARAERDPSLGILLLTDCRRVFTERDVDRLTTEELITALIDLTEAPWGDLRGKPIDDRGLARRLRKYDIRPGSHRFEAGTLRGYLREDMHDAWARYLQPVADVALVPDPQPMREAPGNVAVLPFEGVGGFSSNTQNGSLSSSEKAQQAQQAQHDEADRLAWLTGLETTIAAEELARRTP